MSGKHVAPESGTFLRDLVIMLAGIVAVGAVVFGGLWILSGDEEAAPSTTASNGAGTPAPTGEPAGGTPPPEPSTTTTTPTTPTTPTTSTTAAPTTSSTVVAARDPSEVRVLVLNSTGVNGLASRVSNRLRDAGYQTLTPDNYGSGPLDLSRVWYQGDFGTEAFDLAGAFFPDAVVEVYPEAPVEADIIVVLGSSFEE